MPVGDLPIMALAYLHADVLSRHLHDHQRIERCDLSIAIDVHRWVVFAAADRNLKSDRGVCGTPTPANQKIHRDRYAALIRIVASYQNICAVRPDIETYRIDANCDINLTISRDCTVRRSNR